MLRLHHIIPQISLLRGNRTRVQIYYTIRIHVMAFIQQTANKHSHTHFQSLPPHPPLKEQPFVPLLNLRAKKWNSMNYWVYLYTAQGFGLFTSGVQLNFAQKHTQKLNKQDVFLQFSNIFAAALFLQRCLQHFYLSFLFNRFVYKVAKKRNKKKNLVIFHSSGSWTFFLRVRNWLYQRQETLVCCLQKDKKKKPLGLACQLNVTQHLLGT